MVETSSSMQEGVSSYWKECSGFILSPFRSTTKAVSSAMICAALIRLLVIFFRYRYLAAPTLDHGDFGAEMGWVARSLALHRGFSSPFYPESGPTALVPPIFPFILSLIFRVSGLYTPLSALGILAFQSACSVMTCLPVSLIAKRIRDKRAGDLAAWIWALYPFSIYYSSGEIWDYALTAFLFTTIVALLLRLRAQLSTGKWLSTGILIGLGGLTNPSLLPAAFLLALFAVLAQTRSWRQSFPKGAALFFMAALVLLPWSLRNELRLGSWVPVRDGFWLEAWAGNHGDTFVTNPASAHPASNATEMALFRNQGEVGYLKSKKSLTKDWILRHPELFLQTTARRILRFWTGFWNLNPAYIKKEPFDIPACLLCTSITTLMLLGFRVMWRESLPSFWSLASVMLVFPCPYYVTHASMDYRQPVEPLVVVLISLGLLGWRRSSVQVGSR